MKLFYTNSVKHLAERIKIPKGKFLIKKFSDGEIYVKVSENVKDKPIWVLGSTNAPSDNLLELLLLLDALQRSGAKLNLFIPYFAYARQGVARRGEALSLEVVANFFKNFKLRKIVTVHLHNDRLRQYLNVENVIPISLYMPILKKADILVAPDAGGILTVKKLARECGCGVAIIEKRRPEQDKAEAIKLIGNVAGKKVIMVDDVISTGGTVIAAAEVLKKAKAEEISVLSTHGIFSGNAVADLQKSPIERIYVTNTIFQKKHTTQIETIDISSFVENSLIRDV